MSAKCTHMQYTYVHIHTQSDLYVFSCDTLCKFKSWCPSDMNLYSGVSTDQGYSCAILCFGFKVLMRLISWLCYTSATNVFS